MNHLSAGGNIVERTVRFFLSLRGKLLLVFLGLALIPLVIISTISFYLSQEALNERVKTELESSTSMQANMLHLWLHERLDNMVVLAGTARVRTMDPAKVVDAVDQYFKQWQVYEVIGLYTPDGVSVYRTDKASKNIAGLDYFKKALAQEVVLSEPMVSDTSGNVVVWVAAPVVEKNKVLGVVAGAIPISMFDNFTGVRSEGVGDSYLINHEGYLMTVPKHTEELRRSGAIKNRPELELQVKTDAAEAAIKGESGVKQYLDITGQMVMGAYRPIESTNWAMITESDLSVILAPVENLRNISIITMWVALLVVAAVAIYTSSRITRPLLKMTGASRHIAQGDVGQTISYYSRDEIGTLADSFREIILYFQQIAETSSQLAEGNLTIHANIHSEQDVVGMALERMIDQLRTMIGRIMEYSALLDTSSNEMAKLLNQVEDITAQIAQTSHQIAQGTGEQADSISQTASAVEQLNESIGGLANGAGEQHASIAKTRTVTNELVIAIQEVAGNVKTAANEAVIASEAAQKGGNTVQQTLTSIQAIRKAVGASAEKVKEMGTRSEQIGNIITTIEDIAGQTNMLALNAAIEAARAGESGRGFAVVAEEVRKLAESSSGAAKEISKLIKGIQQTVQEAVAAMNNGVIEIEQGVTLAGESGGALEGIRSASEKVNGRVKLASATAEKMMKLAEEIVSSIEIVAMVIENNNSSIDEMNTSSNKVTSMTENIASISEENSAALQQVSASTDEVSQRVIEVSGSAKKLADMARSLQDMVGQFKIR
jgi:methyl-accepting chemotaxis protein